MKTLIIEREYVSYSIVREYYAVDEINENIIQAAVDGDLLPYDTKDFNGSPEETGHYDVLDENLNNIEING